MKRGDLVKLASFYNCNTIGIVKKVNEYDNICFIHWPNTLHEAQHSWILKITGYRWEDLSVITSV